MPASRQMGKVRPGWHSFLGDGGMTRRTLYIVFLAGLLVGSIVFSKCGSDQRSSSVNNPATDTSSSMGPAPDNNSANNPSLADTNYEKNRTRPITDTMKQDTVRRH